MWMTVDLLLVYSGFVMLASAGAAWVFATVLAISSAGLDMVATGVYHC
jgi:hypothetical protein